MREKLNRLNYKFTKLLHLHQAFVVITVVLVILIAVFIRINTLNEMPVDQAFLDSEVSKIKTVNFDKTAIKEIEALSDSDVTVPGTDLPANRKNPFSE